jgi:branched-chain amino acid transport system substrate-binding protein
LKHLIARGSRVALGVTGVLLATTALSACGSSDTKADPPGTSGGASALGPEKKATGAALKIGFVHEGVSAAIDTSEMAKAATAVVKYVNAHLGGIGGRPVEVVFCETHGTPASAQDCGNQMVSQKVLAVVSGSLGQTEPVVKAVTAAGIPMVDILNQSPGFLGSPIAFTLSNPLNAFGGPAIYAKKNNLKKVALVTIDVPAAIQPAKQLAPLLFGNAGAAADVVGIAPGTADATPQIQAAEAKKPDLYHIVGNPSFCAAVLKAIKTLGITTKVTGIDRCLDKTSAASIPGGFSGMTVFTPANLEPGDEETKLYDAVRETYGAGIEHSPVFSTGYQALLGLVRVLNAGSITDFTSAGIVKTIKAAPPVALPLGGGAEFQCNGKQIAISPAICSTNGITADAQEDGSLKNFTTLTDPSIYAFPKK